MISTTNLYSKTHAGYNTYMEDRVILENDLGSQNEYAFYAVCDGHGGSQTADYLVSHLGHKINTWLTMIQVHPIQ